MESTENRKTLEAYEASAEKYVNGTAHVSSADVSDWIKRALSGLPTAAKILELGSAFGRDAADAEKLGYAFQCTDAAQSFVSLLRKQGREAYVLNAITDELGQGWDMVYANCVFLHFTAAQFKAVLDKIHGSLSEGGILAFALKRGEGSEWSSEKMGAPRFFHYWTQVQLNELLSGAKLEVVDMRDGITEGDSNKIYVVARKK